MAEEENSSVTGSGRENWLQCYYEGRGALRISHSGKNLSSLYQGQRYAQTLQEDEERHTP